MRDDTTDAGGHEPPAPFDLAEVRRRSAAHRPGQGLTTEQVLARLEALRRSYDVPPVGPSSSIDEAP